MSLNIKNVNKLGKLLQKYEATIAVAESVTSGNLQVAFSLATNATLFFQGGITTYNIGQKCRHLLIEPIHAVACNCVSQKVSEQMASEVCNLFKSEYGVGITGYASPVPEQNVKQLYAWVAIAKNCKIVKSIKIVAAGKSPVEVQMYFTNRTIEILTQFLDKNGSKKD